jgi:hypothetical protein
MAFVLLKYSTRTYVSVVYANVDQASLQDRPVLKHFVTTLFIRRLLF